MGAITIAEADKLQGAASNARAALRAIRSQQVSVVAIAPQVGGGLVAGLIDGMWGEGAASIPGLLLLAVGWWFGMPMVMQAGAALLSPAAYRLGTKISGGGIGALRDQVTATINNARNTVSPPA